MSALLQPGAVIAHARAVESVETEPVARPLGCRVTHSGCDSVDDEDGIGAAYVVMDETLCCVPCGREVLSPRIAGELWRRVPICGPCCPDCGELLAAWEV